MKILILVDLMNDWALHNRAKAIQKYLPEHQFEIRAGLRNFEALVDYDQFDLIHFNFTYGITDFYDFIMRNIKKVVITIVNERSFLFGFGVDPEKLNYIIYNCKNVTSVSPRIAELTGCLYIPNGIDEDIFPEPNNPIIGYSGTFKDNKNVQVIYEACKELGLELRTAAYNNGVGQYQHIVMQEFYRGLDVYVHASLTEGFNNTVLEALACNVPVLMTREGAWNEFEDWVEFIEPTVEGVKKGLQKFTGRRLVKQKFLFKNIVHTYKKVYEKVYENR